MWVGPGFSEPQELPVCRAGNQHAALVAASVHPRACGEAESKPRPGLLTRSLSLNRIPVWFGGHRMVGDSAEQPCHLAQHCFPSSCMAAGQAVLVLCMGVVLNNLRTPPCSLGSLEPCTSLLGSRSPGAHTLSSRAGAPGAGVSSLCLVSQPRSLVCS